MKILFVTTLGLLGALAGATTFTGSRSTLAAATSSKTGYASGPVDVTDLRTIASIGSTASTNPSHRSLSIDGNSASASTDVSASAENNPTGTSALEPQSHGAGSNCPNGSGSGSGAGSGPGPGAGGCPHAVPEPASLAALGVLAMIRHKRKGRNK